MKILLFILLFTSIIFSQVEFEEYFENRTLRFDYYHSGDKDSEWYSFDEMIEEPYWGGSKVNLIDNFNFGSYKFYVYDISSNKLIYSRGYSTLFSEWQTTEEAEKTVKSFSETVVFPYPKNKVRLEFYSRDEENELVKKFQYKVDPRDYFIKDDRRFEYPFFKVLESGDPAVKIDIVIIPDGYTKEQMNLFREDCEKFSGYLLGAEPFKENNDKFNIWGVEVPSEETGTDIPADNIWRKTVLNTSFYTFDLERYCMTSDNKSVRDAAANAPYDQIYILVNSSKYGGGAIYNHYAVCVNSSPYAEYVFTHEFGHSFGFLADEYYLGDVAYKEFYKLDVEPLETNLTTLVNFDSKWKAKVNKDIPIPTPNNKKYRDVIGVFEGGGYTPKGIYRPEFDCTMNSNSYDNFCEICKETLQMMIDFYTK